MAVLAASAFRWGNRLLKGWTGIWILLSALFFAERQEAWAEGVAKEYQVKAAFLYNFFQFVDWPPQAFAEPQEPLVIGVIGDDPFNGYLDELVRGEKIKSHPLVVRRYHQLDEIKQCHVLYVCQSESRHLKEVLSMVKGKNILTVSDADGFVRDGGIIRFVTENNKIRFKINVDAARAARLTISSKLMQAAEKE